MTEETSPEAKKPAIPAGAPIKKVDPLNLAAKAADQKPAAKPLARRSLVVAGADSSGRPKLVSQADETEIVKPRFVTPLMKEQIEKEAAEAAAQAEAEAARAAEEEARLAAEAAAKAEAEAAEEARRIAEQQALEEEEARQAQEEYERQMREYEEQLAAYERQQAEEARIAAEQAAAQHAAQQAAALAAQQAAAAAQQQAPVPATLPAQPAMAAAGAPLAANLQATLDQIRAMQEALAVQAQAMALVAQQAGLVPAQPAHAPALATPAHGIPVAPAAQQQAPAPIKLGAPKLSLSALKGPSPATHDAPTPQQAPASPFAGSAPPSLLRPHAATPETAQPAATAPRAASPFANAPLPISPHAHDAAPQAAGTQPATAPAVEEQTAAPAPRLSLNAGGAPQAAASSTPRLARPGLATGAAPAALSASLAAPPPQAGGDLPDHELTEEEQAKQAQQDAYYRELQAAAAQVPWHKKKNILILLGCFLALFIGVGIAYYFKVQNDNARAAEDKKVQTLLKIAERINKSLIVEPKGDLSLAALQAKNVDLGSINDESYKRLLKVVKSPEKNIGVARNAIIYLAVMMAQNSAICDQLFTDIVKNPEDYEKNRFDWLTQNIAATNMPDAKKKLLALVPQLQAKKAANSDDLIYTIYANIAASVDAGDFNDMLTLINDEKTTPRLIAPLSNNVLAIIEKTARENRESAAALGDKIVDSVDPKQLRGNLLIAVAKAASPKGLEHIKKRMAEAKDPRAEYGVWTAIKQALTMWGNDDIVAYIIELKEKSAETNPLINKEINSALGALLVQDRQRTDEEFDKLVNLVYGDLNTDTSEYVELNNQLSPGAKDEVPSKDPRYAGLQARMEKVKPLHDQKIVFCKTLSAHTENPQVMRYLDKMGKDSDSLVAIEAKDALTKVKRNTQKAAEAKARETAKKN